jgi:hypothetical protein
MTTNGAELTRRPEEGPNMFLIPGRIDDDERRYDFW